MEWLSKLVLYLCNVRGLFSRSNMSDIIIRNENFNSFN